MKRLEISAKKEEKSPFFITNQLFYIFVCINKDFNQKLLLP